MLQAVISDVHGNMPALQAVFKDIDGLGIKSIVCLGDSVGYGPEPNEVVNLLKSRKIPSIRGNHEQALFDWRVRISFNPFAEQAIILTRRILLKENIQWLRELPFFRVEQNARYVHGMPPRSHFRYVHHANNEMLACLMGRLKQDICFVGHTHKLALISSKGKKVIRSQLNGDSVTLRSDKKYIINVGSVGVQRDEDKRAKYVVWDSARGEVTARKILYDNGCLIRKIQEYKFPEQCKLIFQ